MKKVLITLDYDPTAKKVAEEGFAFAKAMGAEVILLHVVIDLVAYSLTYLNMGPMQLESVEDINNAAQHFLDNSKHHLGDETIQTIVKEGGLAETILKTAKEMDVDIIVVGSHSRRWLENILMGSVTEDVLRKTTIPLLIIPTKKHN